MNLKDTDIETKRKQAIEALVADSTTLAERLLKAEDPGPAKPPQGAHTMAQNSSPHYLCDYSAITIADKDAGITKITYSDTVEETPPNSPHKVVPFDFGRGPVPGYYVTSIQAEGTIIPDGSDVQVSYRRQGDEDTVCDTLRSVRQVRPGEYVCDWIYWDGLRPLGEAPELRKQRDVVVAARGGGATATGSVGVIVATGAQLVDASGTVTLKLRTGFTMPGGGTQAITIDAVTKGEAGNLAVGTVLRWVSPPAGLSTTVTLTTALSGGYSVESDVDLALRIVRRLQNRPRGGSCYDYREWAESAEDGSGGLVGVLRAYVYPGREGAGSVTVVPTLGGSGSARIPTTTQIAQIQGWIDSLKICTDTCFVVKPRVVSGEELTVTATVQPQTAFDWIDTFTVNAASGTGTTLVVDGLPSTLRDAIDNGNKPRIAITIDSYSPIPFVSRVTAHQDGVPMVGQYTLTLETALPADPTGYRVHPAGSATVPVASAILSTIDAFGPSRSSGMADANDRWEDRVTVAALASAVVRSVDSNGERVVVTSPGVGVGTGITIKVGAAAASGADYVTLDNSHTLGPPVPRCIAVVVRSA